MTSPTPGAQAAAELIKVYVFNANRAYGPFSSVVGNALNMFILDLEPMIAHALTSTATTAAEAMRERCARVADKYGVYPTGGLIDDSAEGRTSRWWACQVERCEGAKNIATAIRALPVRDA